MVDELRIRLNPVQLSLAGDLATVSLLVSSVGGWVGGWGDEWVVGWMGTGGIGFKTN